MTIETSDFASLVGSRICHDLISPLGAISNGVELLELTGNTSGEELQLIVQSVENAKARIRLFRIAFGSGDATRHIDASEVREVLSDFNANGRINVNWCPDTPLGRDTAKLIFLLVLCLETAMPYRGRVSVTNTGASWSLVGEADKLSVRQDLWEALASPPQDIDVQASDVHFALVADLVARSGKRLDTRMEAQRISIRF